MSDQNTPEVEAADVTTTDDLSALADELVVIAKKQYDTAVLYRQPKLDAIMKAEELYYNKVQRTLKARFNIPLPIVSGFVDTLLAKIDDEITINFDHTETADIIRARKVSAAWKYDSAPTRGMWTMKDLLIKKLAIFSGRGIAQVFSESDPTYRNYFEIVDAFDFLCEPQGGWHLENHLFCGVQNVFRTKSQLENGSQYNQAQVQKLISRTNSNDYKVNQDLYLNHQKRLNNAGLDPDTNNYVGEPLFNLTQWNMTHNGERYYLFFDHTTATWIRIEKLEDITGEPQNDDELPLYMFKSWATHPDYWNFWSKAPVDDIVPVATGMKIITNFMLDRFQKKLWGQRIFDAEVIQDPSQLEWDRPDKLISAVLPAGKRLSDSVYEFQTGDDSSITINLLDYMRNFVALESGVTSDAKGNSDDKVLGVAQINEGNVADRLGLTNKMYVQFYAECGLSYLRGLKLCMTTKLLIRMIGENGSESAELTKEDLKFSVEPDIRISGGKTEMLKNDRKKAAKINALTAAATLAPDLLNKQITVESILQAGEWDADEISALMDVTSDGSEIESIKASQAIQDILNGKKPKPYIGATTRFQQKILDFANEKTDDPKMRVLLTQYALAHKQIVIQNMARKAMLANMTQKNNPQNPPALPQSTPQPKQTTAIAPTPEPQDNQPPLTPPNNG